MNTKLRCLTENDEKAYKFFVKEFTDAGERIIPSAVESDGLSFAEWLERTGKIVKGIDLPKGWVPATTYFFFNEDESKILGAIDIRHRLNEHLLSVGGNIGYGVAPSERRKGYASTMLKEALEICKEMGMNKVLITCNKENIASAKTIIKNGGVLENEVKDEKGNLRQRHWIAL